MKVMSWFNSPSGGLYSCLAARLKIEFRDRIQTVNLSREQYIRGAEEIKIIYMESDAKMALQRLILFGQSHSGAVDVQEARTAWHELR